MNIVGDHAVDHAHLDAPLTSDVEAVAAPFSHWVRTSKTSRAVGRDAAEAVAAARAHPGRIASLILPADASWNEPGGPAKALPVAAASHRPDETIEEIAKHLQASERPALLLSGRGPARPGPRARGGNRPGDGRARRLGHLLRSARARRRSPVPTGRC